MLLQKKFIDALLLAAFLYLLNLGFKNYGYYLMVSLPLLARSLVGFLEWLMKVRQANVSASSTKEKSTKEFGLASSVFNVKGHQGLAVVIIILTTLISISCINDGFTIALKDANRFGFTEDNSQLPVEATAFLNKNKIKGKLLNHLNFGGYLLAHTNNKVFIDGRLELIDETFFNNYYTSITEISCVKNMLDTVKPEIVIFPHGNAIAWWYYFLSFKHTSGYKLVYFDGLSVIYLKSSMYPEIAELNEQNILKNLDVNSIRRIDSLISASSKPDGVAVWLNSIWKK